MCLDTIDPRHRPCRAARAARRCKFGLPFAFIWKNLRSDGRPRAASRRCREIFLEGLISTKTARTVWIDVSIRARNKRKKKKKTAHHDVISTSTHRMRPRTHSSVGRAGAMQSGGESHRIHRARRGCRGAAGAGVAGAAGGAL